MRFGRFAALLVAGALLVASGGCSRRRTPAAVQPRFRDVAAEAGVDFEHFTGATGKKYFPETMGSGAAVFDYDNDGWLDLLFVNGRPLERPAAPGDPTLRLYRNLGPGGGLRFRDVTTEAGLAVSLYGMGCAVADYDNDGWDDVYVSSVLAPGRLFRNRKGRFEDAGESAGVGHARRWGTGCAFLDYDRDGWLDLYVASYVRYASLSDDMPCYARGSRRSYCIPAKYEGSSGALYRNLRRGRFEDVTRQAGLWDPAQKALGVAATDLNGDGWTDLVVANDTELNRAFLNRKGRFEDSALACGLAYGPTGAARAGMGVAAADWSGSGSPSVAFTNFAGEAIGLFVTPASGELVYTDEAAALGIAQTSRPLLGFGIEFLDVDNDGYQDLGAVNGHVRDDIEELEPGQHYPQPALLFHNQRGKRFTDWSAAAGPPVTSAAVRRGLAVGDLDNDGRVDMVVTRSGGAAEVWRNETRVPGGSHWLSVRLRGSVSNRNAIGARVTLRAGKVAQNRWVRSGGSYLSESDRRLHFGLGGASRFDEIEVVWPSGRKTRYPGGPADRQMTLEESVQ